MMSEDDRTITVKYFAALREQAGRREQEVETGAETPRELFRELKHQHPFDLAEEHMRVSINSTMADWDDAIETGDEVSFLPPVSGG